MHMSNRSLVALIAASLSIAVACSPKGDSAVGVSVEAGSPVATSWALSDVNPTSPTFEQVVSPADLIGQVSVWYFGHST
jgi:hypothetical protein